MIKRLGNLTYIKDEHGNIWALKDAYISNVVYQYELEGNVQIEKLDIECSPISSLFDRDKL